MGLPGWTLNLEKPLLPSVRVLSKNKGCVSHFMSNVCIFFKSWKIENRRIRGGGVPATVSILVSSRQPLLETLLAFR